MKNIKQRIFSFVIISLIKQNKKIILRNNELLILGFKKSSDPSCISEVNREKADIRLTRFRWKCHKIILE